MCGAESAERHLEARGSGVKGSEARGCRLSTLTHNFAIASSPTLALARTHCSDPPPIATMLLKSLSLLLLLLASVASGERRSGPLEEPSAASCCCVAAGASWSALEQI